MRLDPILTFPRIRGMIVEALILVENTSDIYCWLGKIGILNYDRCLIPTGNVVPIPDGPTEWFEWTVLISAILLITTYYTLLIKGLISLKKRCYSDEVI